MKQYGRSFGQRLFSLFILRAEYGIFSVLNLSDMVRLVQGADCFHGGRCRHQNREGDWKMPFAVPSHQYTMNSFINKMLS